MAEITHQELYVQAHDAAKARIDALSSQLQALEEAGQRNTELWARTGQELLNAEFALYKLIDTGLRTESLLGLALAREQNRPARRIISIEGQILDNRGSAPFSDQSIPEVGRALWALDIVKRFVAAKGARLN